VEAWRGREEEGIGEGKECAEAREQRGNGGERTLLLSSPWPDGPICPCLSRRRPSFSPASRALHLLVISCPDALGSPSQLKLENIDCRKNNFQAAPQDEPLPDENKSGHEVRWVKDR
jgi:hypothetical protein